MTTLFSRITASKPFRVSLASTLLIEVILWIGLKWEIPYITSIAIGQFFLATYLSISIGIPKHCDYFCFPTTAMP